MMKKINYLKGFLLSLMLMISVNASAYDFVVDGIYYTKETDGVSVTVTYKEYLRPNYSRDIVIPETVTYEGITYCVTSIGEYAFRNCSGLTSIEIPNSVTSIGEYAFQNCSGLTSIEIPNSVTSIGDWAFSGCSGLTSIEIPNSVTSIEGGVFYHCSGLTSIEIPNSVTSIESYTFEDCNLYEVIIGTNVTSIAENAFSENDIRKVIWLPNTPPSGYEKVRSAQHYVANKEYGFGTVYQFLSSIFEVDGIRYVPVSPSERTCDAIGCKYDGTSTVKIDKTVSYRGIDMEVINLMPYLCYGNDSIETIEIDYEGDISKYAFYDCDGVKTISINAGTIGESAFYSCDAIESLTLKANNVYEGAFANCATMKAATFDIDVDSIGTSVFSGCTNVNTITVDASTIGESAFYECKNLIKVTLGNGITSIGESGFSGCSKLQRIILPNSMTSLGAAAFSGCSSLASVQIGSRLEKIEKSTFDGCSALPTITIPASVTSVENFVFNDCTSLAEVNISDRETELSLGCNRGNKTPLFSDCPLKKVYIGGNITYDTRETYGYSPFYRNTTLEEVIITDKETEISENEFYGCTALKSITMGDGVESIGNWAFSGCSSMESFKFGNGMKTIGQEAFSDCTALTLLESRALVPPTCGANALDDINKWNCTLHVPQGAKTEYAAAEQWKEFFFVEDDVTGVGVNSVSGDGAKVKAIYNLSGKNVSEPQKGQIYIFRYGNGKTVKKLVK